MESSNFSLKINFNTLDIMVKIKILVDNRAEQNSSPLASEHGLSFYVEMQNMKILCDMGLSDAFLSNAQKLGVDLEHLDFAFLSHGHIDHTGGLGDFLRINKRTPIYLSEKIATLRLFSSRHSLKREIGSRRDLIETNAARFVFVKDSFWVNDSIAIVQNNSWIASKPYGNKFLSMMDEGQEMQDDFMHELALVLKTDKGLIIISSCSHSGAINIMNSCVAFTGESRVCAFVGGLHFVDSEQVGSEIEVFERELKASYADAQIVTGHCTGDMAKGLLAEKMPQVSFFYAGAELKL